MGLELVSRPLGDIKLFQDGRPVDVSELVLKPNLVRMERRFAQAFGVLAVPYTQGEKGCRTRRLDVVVGDHALDVEFDVRFKDGWKASGPEMGPGTSILKAGSRREFHVQSPDCGVEMPQSIPKGCQLLHG